jgi:hypothetical protein
MSLVTRVGRPIGLEAPAGGDQLDHRTDHGLCHEDEVDGVGDPEVVRLDQGQNERPDHAELLDAAHIIGDAETSGDPVVSNGLSLCKLHHAAFDRHFLTVRPDYRIEARQSVLDEEDGPMLLHGLKEMHERPILLPSQVSLQPDRDRLTERYRSFMVAP